MTPQNCNVTSRLDPEQAQIPLKMKKSSSAGLFRLFSKGTSSEPKYNLSPPQQEDQKLSVSAELRGLGLEVIPCNYIRPRGLKLEPRKESTPTPRNSTYRSHRPPPIVTTSGVSLEFTNECNQSILPATKEKSELGLRRASNNPFPNGHLAVDPQLANKMCTGSALKSPNSPLMSPVSLIHETGLPAFASLRVQFVVGRIAMDFGSSARWTDWLNSYSNGEFNIQNPPAPPPLSPTFSHLPAAYPRDEEQRCLCSKKFDLVWRESMQERVGAHVRAALKKFGTRYGSMSFFDEEYELFIAENGYNVSRIQRSNSIAAHALYSTEVLSVIDTQKDWRFQSSPITIGKPYIRFFAAAPLVTPKGDIIGVLSIFSRTPRKSFTHDQRRQLAECSAALMADISTQLDNPKGTQSLRLSQPSILSEIARNSNVNATSIQQVNSLIMQDPLNQTNTGDNVDANLISTKKLENKKTNSPALRYHQPDSTENLTGLIFSTKPLQGCSQVPGEQTPPSSAKSNSGLGFEVIRTTAIKIDPLTSNKREYSVRGDSISSCNAAIVPHNSCHARLLGNPSELATNKNGELISGGIGGSLGEGHPKLSLLPHTPVNSDPVGNSIPSTHEKTTSSDLRLRNFTRPLSPLTTSLQLTAHDSTNNFHRPDSPPQPKNEVSVEDFMLLSDGDIIEFSDDLVPVESKLPEKNEIPLMPNSCVNTDSNFQKETTGDPISYPYQNCGKEIWISDDTCPPVNSQTECKDVTRKNENRSSWQFPRPRTDTIETYCTGSSFPTSGDENYSPKSPSSSVCYPPIPLNCDPSFQKNPFCDVSKTKLESTQFETFETGSSKNNCQAVSNFSQLPFDESSRCHPSPSLHDSRCPSLSLSMNSAAVHKRPTQEAVSQSAISLASHCKLMGYSLMYIAKVYPYRSSRYNTNEPEINAQKLDDIKVQLLTAHGLTDTIQLCPLIHLRVLRSRGPTTWEDQSEHNEFKKGILMVIKSEGGPLRQRSRGLILGAFREAQASSDLKPQDTAMEMKALVALAQNLKLILTTSSSSQSSQISNMSPEPSAWLPNDKLGTNLVIDLHVKHIIAS
ncbi:Bgt-4713 [Blumeria graminis f. sp. tritici]|uniref:Bgt-4713 n=3 Tax=Blumeria graminis TaxID=34373 RepID=A0A061HPP3_BLUGR|nr:hypothetical protein BGT96224_4713 [Blumeria graminis f. sp. tritici 96224]VDB93892.1 Bgt-4713 [Blumeria graminis f. sp. tritici]